MNLGVVSEMAFLFVGGLGIFLLGMKYMQQGLQVVAGNSIRRMINALTANRLLAVGVGLFITTLVQSSSVTSVMVIGLVNSELMALNGAIGVIIGANIGTTITGWMLAIRSPPARPGCLRLVVYQGRKATILSPGDAWDWDGFFWFRAHEGWFRAR